MPTKKELKYEVVSILWSHGWSEDEIRNVLSMTLTEVIKTRALNERYLKNQKRK